MKDKIALFCDVDARAVVTARDVHRSTKSRWCSPKKAWTRSSCGI
jgi:CTP synthase (UTP-ammonia lyase)